MKDKYEKLIREFVEDSYGEYTLHESYSGRHQYGQTCLGISGILTSGQILLDLVRISISEFGDLDDVEDFIETCLRDYNEDSLGRGTIVYFPNSKD